MASDDGDKEKSFQKRVEEALASGMPISDFPDASPLAGLTMAYAEAVEEFEKRDFSRGEALYLTSAMFCNNPGLGPAH